MKWARGRRDLSIAMGTSLLTVGALPRVLEYDGAPQLLSAPVQRGGVLRCSTGAGWSSRTSKACMAMLLSPVLMIPGVDVVI